MNFLLHVLRGTTQRADTLCVRRQMTAFCHTFAARMLHSKNKTLLPTAREFLSTAREFLPTAREFLSMARELFSTARDFLSATRELFPTDAEFPV